MTVVLTIRPPIVTVSSPAERSSPDGCALVSRTIETRDSMAVWTAITRGFCTSAEEIDGAREVTRKTTSPPSTARSRGGRQRGAGTGRDLRRGVRKDHEVVTVMSRGRVERASARHQSDFRLQRRVVDEVAGEEGLLVLVLSGHDEARGRSVGPIDRAPRPRAPARAVGRRPRVPSSSRRDRRARPGRPDRGEDLRTTSRPCPDPTAPRWSNRRPGPAAAAHCPLRSMGCAAGSVRGNRVRPSRAVRRQSRRLGIGPRRCGRLPRRRAAGDASARGKDEQRHDQPKGGCARPWAQRRAGASVSEPVSRAQRGDHVTRSATVAAVPP